MLQKPENNPEKIYANRVKAYGHKHLTATIVDIMLGNPTEQYTILSLQKAIRQQKRYWYERKAIEGCINILSEMKYLQLIQHRVTRGRNTRVKAFSITIKQIQNENQTTLFQ